MFIQYESPTLNNRFIHPKWCLLSDHAPLTITISISEKVINTCKSTIKKDSNEEVQFMEDTINIIKNLNVLNLSDIHMLKNIVNKLSNNVDETWNRNVKLTNIMRHSKSW